jgi:hypothetical protein
MAGLRDDGFEQVPPPPRQITQETLTGADTVVSFGCDLSGVGPPPAMLVDWADVPAVSDGFGAARDEIVRRLEGLLEELERQAAPGSRG